MKKSFVSIVMLLLITVICLNSCNASSLANAFDLHKVTVTGGTNHLGHPISPYYKSGEIVQLKVHKITCAGFFVYLNNNILSSSGYDEKYVFYEFEMPDEDVTIHLTFDPFYGRDKYSFDELIYWFKFLDNSIYNVSVGRVSMKINNYSDETSFIETRYSTKQVDIDNFKRISDQPLIKSSYEEMGDTDIYTTYLFYENDGTDNMRWLGELNFKDNFFSHFYNETSSPQPFRFEDPNYVLPTIEDPDYVTYSFRRENGITYVKKYEDESFSLRYDYMTDVEFVPYEGEIIDIKPVFYIDSKCGRINLLNADVFELNGEYYEVVSGSWVYSNLKLGSKK